MGRATLVAGWLIVLAAVSMLAVMRFGSIAHLSRLANGQEIFDLRFGYSWDETQRLLVALNPEARVYYLTVQHRLDTVFLVLECLSFLFLYRLLLDGLARRGRRLSGVVTGILLALPVGGMLADLAENATVGRMLVETDDLLLMQLSAKASLLTRTKFALIAASVAGLVGLVGRLSFVALRIPHDPV